MAVKKVEKCVLVLGRNVDTDAVVASWWFCKANGLEWGNLEQVRFKFVFPGERVRPKSLWSEEKGLDQAWIVVHIDTGRIHNPGAFYFDHHTADGSGGGKKFSSAAKLVHKAYPSDDHVVHAIISFAHWVDNAEISKAKESCQGDFGHILDPLPAVLAGLQDENGLAIIPSEQIVLTGLGIIQAFYASCLRERAFFSAIASDELEEKADGFVLLGTTSTTTKNLRNFVMRKKKQVKVVVASYPNEGDHGRIGVSCLRSYEDKTILIDLSAVRDRLREIDQEADLFLHDSQKFLYVERTDRLTLDIVWDIVEPMIDLVRLYKEAGLIAFSGVYLNLKYDIIKPYK